MGSSRTPRSRHQIANRAAMAIRSATLDQTRSAGHAVDSPPERLAPPRHIDRYETGANPAQQAQNARPRTTLADFDRRAQNGASGSPRRALGGGWASEKANDEVACDLDARREGGPVVPGYEADVRVGCGAGFAEGVGEPEGALAEPVAKHGHVTVAGLEFDDVPLGGDKSGP